MLTKQAIYHQFTSFLGIAVYLFLLFGILVMHEAVVSAKGGIEYHFYGFAIINALVLGKVILVADDFHFAEWFKERAPIYSILAKAAAFTILLLVFDIVEEVVVGKFKGQDVRRELSACRGWKSACIFLCDYYLHHCADPVLLVQGNRSSVWRA
jgi:hypothetical protein